MSKQLFTKLAATLCILATIALNTGCGTSVVGPEQSTPQVEKMGRSSTPPVILPVPPTYAPPRADLTGDGFVDASDLAAFAATLTADLNGDRAVDELDKQMLGAVLARTPIDRNHDGFIDASDLAAYAWATARADQNHDGRVDASDVAAFAAKIGKGDVNEDGSVNSRDLTVIQKSLGLEIEPPSKVS